MQLLRHLNMTSFGKYYRYSWYLQDIKSDPSQKKIRLQSDPKMKEWKFVLSEL